jgi:type II secretory pathway pseudopilin PulG
MQDSILHHRNPAQRARHRATAFTLVELLVVLTVMVSLAGMMTYALASAQTDARIKRTQADLLSIGQLLQTRMNEVSLSRVNLVYGPITPAVLGAAAPAFGPGAPPNNASEAQLITFEAAERARLFLMARRDMLRLVLPECQSDLLYPPASLQFRTRDRSVAPGFRPAPFIPNVAQLKTPPQWSQMRGVLGLLSAESIDAVYANSYATQPEYDAIIESGVPAFESLLRQRIDGTPMTWTREHESSECLYLILATTELFGTKAIDQIPSSRIRDTDGDGVPEILDAWDQPYMFIRNPVGLNNAAVKNYKPTAATPAEQYPIDPDPLDMLVSDFRYLSTFRPGSNPFAIEQPYFPIYLPPVLISAGRDREFGIRQTFFDADGDGVGDEGVARSYSSSVVQFPNGVNGPTYPGIRVWRYPDPFFDVASMPITSTGVHVIRPEGIVSAKGSDAFVAPNLRGGLGFATDLETSADNITSLDAGF